MVNALILWENLVKLFGFREGSHGVSKCHMCHILVGITDNMDVELAFKLFHHGRRPGLSFYGDRSGNEVDLIVGRGRELAAIEVKSGQTVTRMTSGN